MHRPLRLLIVLLALAFAVGRHRAPQRETPPPVPPSEPLGYDLRKGASAYAPIIGSIGGLVVPAIVLIFEIASSEQGAVHREALGRATAFLVLGFLACLLSAFALAAIGAERRLTANLTAATIYAGAATVIGIVAVIAAFEVLAHAFFPAMKDLFMLITAGSAIGGAVLVSMVLGDAWVAAPPDHWLEKRSSGYRWGSISSGVATAVLVVGAVLSFSGVRLPVQDSEMHWFVGIGIVLSLSGSLGSAFRTMHSPDGDGRAITKTEAAAVLLILVTYLFLLLLVMP